ncbi:glycosyltransferase family 2 protein [Myroides fluvii]|uniref:glycosyltransferase family 2 protein n=1 Tax=Myroides fluvii TaxID=2572594 RepID=UPI00131A6985|nr:glycosyltransferase family A protein [Myroides fluvii]
MSKISISVVIPCYNCSDTIQVCVESVFVQSYPAYEVILINDGSSDQTLERLYEIQEYYQSEHTKITVRTQTNQGPSVARNEGINFSTGNWIAFLDSDDVWHKDKLLKQVEVLQMYPEALVIGGEKGKFASALSLEHVAKINFAKLGFKNYFLTSSSMVLKEQLGEVRFNVHQKHSEDYRFFFDVLSLGGYGVCIFENLSCSISNKRDFGDSGLSGNIYKMQKGELSNYKYLYSKKLLTFSEYMFFCTFSNLKFVRRFLLSTLYNLKK